MFSTISSYIWGGEAEATGDQQQPLEAAPQATAVPATAVSRPKTANSRRKVQQRDQSPQNGDDWVLIGDDPAPGNLSGDALDPLPPVSETSSVNGEQVNIFFSRSVATL